MAEGGQIGRRGRYGLLLATLIVAYLLSALTSGRTTRTLQLLFFLVVTLLALRTTRVRRRTRVLAEWVALSGSLIMAAVAALSGSPAARGAASIWSGMLLLLTVVIIVERVLRMDAVTIQRIYAALSAYLLIGLMFASFYGAIDSLGSASFFAGAQPDNMQTFQYFSFVTLTTLGYGDFTAAGSFGRAVAVLEALTGQIFLATLVARLVSAYRAPAKPDPPPDDPSSGGSKDKAGSGDRALAGAGPVRYIAGHPRRVRRAVTGSPTMATHWTTLEVAMGLPISERRKLRRMERAIAHTDPRLEALYSMFTRLSGRDAMPRLERVRARMIRRAARVRRAAPLSNAG